MFKARILVAAAALAVAAAGGAVVLTAPAGATTLTCTGTQNQLNTPFGCGGDQLAYTTKGSLDLAVLDGGAYWNSKVGYDTDSTSASAEDWTVFAVNGDTTSGPGHLGKYVAVYTPLGKFASFTYTGGATSCTGTFTNSVPKAGCSFSVGSNVYALSVENLNNGPHGALRWRTVLRNANSNGTFTYGTNTSTGLSSSLTCAPGVENNCVTASRANRYQVWAPVSGAHGLLMVNESLSFDHPHGTNPSNTPYVLDDSGFGGTGTWALAFPENDGLNQESSIIGCTEPITNLNTTYALCP